jgi:mRNA interferase MazF
MTRMTYSMSFAISDIILVPIPFSDLTSTKVRPAVIVGLPPDSSDLFVVPISSQSQNTELPLADWKAAGLNVPCGVKPQIATIERSIVVKTVGKLSTRDKGALDARLRQWLRL